MMERERVSLANPALLTWARASLGYSVDDIAAALRTRPDTVRSWELGEGAPTFAQLRRFAAKVKRSVAVLYLPEPPEDLPPPEDFRHLPGVTPGHFGAPALLAFRTMRNALADLAETMALCGERLSLDLPELSTNDKPAAAGAALRGHLGVSLSEQKSCRGPYAPLDLWRDALFARGVVAQRFPLDVGELRGFSLMHAHLGGIGLSSQDGPLARVFSLLHEVGHLCLGRPGVSADPSDVSPSSDGMTTGVERFCDALAAEVLLPAGSREVLDDLREVARNFDDDTVRRCADRFGVSRHAVARRMLDLGLLDPALYWEAVRRWRAAQSMSRDAGGGSFYTNKLSGLGKRYVAAIIEAADRGVITQTAAADILDVKPTHLPRLRDLLVQSGGGA